MLKECATFVVCFSKFITLMSQKRFLLYIIYVCLTVLTASAQPQFSQPHGLYDRASLRVSIVGTDSEADIRYTTDGSKPTAASRRYTNSLVFTKTTILRAVEVKDGELVSPIATASYLFVSSVLSQSDSPTGYPAQWGSYTEIQGTAKADYGMDAEMTDDPVLRPKIINGLKSLPVLSIVTDKNNLFSHDADSDRGGIYIYTGPPVGDATGHGWTRPASIELMGGEQAHNLSTTCGLRLHGGHGRLAEKNPKHSFRLVFKQEYGDKTLKYPLFGEDEPAKFDQLVLRCHFGNSWQHWAEANRQRAQYARDVWARRMQRRMGRTSVNALYVHLFLNGMYWGLYNIAERVDDQYGKDHLGGKKSDIDVVKVEEDGGNHIEASEGDLEAWNLMKEVVAHASDEQSYAQLDTLLDIDSFIDYMLINQYGGNTDWDHHNWYAIRRRGLDSQGFRFLCWDSEIILENENENVLNKNNGNSFPTGIFHNLMQNEDFARRYLRRAKEVFADDGVLGAASVVEVWDSLYNTIATALYVEAARWGDYRRDVHPYTSRGQLYTVDNHYMTERNRLLQQYFPVRSSRVLSQIEQYVSIDDFDIPDGWEPLVASMFHQWDGSGVDARPLDTPVSVDWHLRQNASGGTAVVGFTGVEHNRYADLSQYDKLVIRGNGGKLRILANRLVEHGPWKQIDVTFSDLDPYWDAELGVLIVPLQDLCETLTSEGVRRDDAFVHLNAIKVDWNDHANVAGIYLIPSEEVLAIGSLRPAVSDGKYYNLSGQQVAHPTHGVYICNGRKVFIK